jgi:hypothetical protein
MKWRERVEVQISSLLLHYHLVSDLFLCHQTCYIVHADAFYFLFTLTFVWGTSHQVIGNKVIANFGTEINL